MKNNAMILKKCILIMGMLLALLGLAYGQTNGDLKTIGNVTTGSITNWQVYNNGWVNVPAGSNMTTLLANAGKITLDHDIVVNTNCTVNGEMKEKPNQNNQGVNFTVNSGVVFTLGANGTHLFCNVTVNAGGRFINEGTMTSKTKNARITMKEGSSPGNGGTLENRGVVDSEGFIDQEMNTVIISGPNGVIQGGALLDVKSNYATIYIANPGGYSAAIKLWRNQNVQNANIVYNATGNQICGTFPEKVYKVTVASGTNLTLTSTITLIDKHNQGLGTPTFLVQDGATLDTGNHVIESEGSSGDSVAQFVLESGATIRTPNANGISSVKGTGGNGNIIQNGAIQTNDATYSEGANYVYYGDHPDQFSGCFVTDPPTDPPADPVYRVHDLTVENPNGLRLCPNFQPLYYTGTLTGGNLIETGPTNTHGTVQHETLPVTLSYFNAFFNGFDSVILQWETQSETNNLGFYVLRSNEPDAALANVVSELVPAANSSQGASYYYEDAALYDDGLYYYWLQDVSFSGAVELHGPCMAYVTLQGGSSQAPDIPLKTSLIRNYPNPFNPSTQLEYYLENGSDVSFEIYNLRGKLVDQFTLRNQAGGLHRYKWEPQLSSGTYLVKFTANGRTNTRKVVLTK